MIGYISGPIAGNPNYKREFNRAAKALRGQGYEVINPAELCRVLPIDELGYEMLLEINLILLSKADYLVQLPGWEHSRETGYAYALGKVVVSLDSLLRG